MYEHTAVSYIAWKQSRYK